MAKPTHEQILKAVLEQFQGLKCWATIAGKGTGSHVTLDFGRKIKRKDDLGFVAQARPSRAEMTPDERRQAVVERVQS